MLDDIIIFTGFLQEHNKESKNYFKELEETHMKTGEESLTEFNILIICLHFQLKSSTFFSQNIYILKLEPKLLSIFLI